LEAVLTATPLARKRVGNISEGSVHAIGPQDIPYESVKKSELENYKERIQINPAQIFPSIVCPFQSRPTNAATIAIPRCAMVMPIYISLFFHSNTDPTRRSGRLPSKSSVKITGIEASN
jgi:hypothetical protein